MKESTLFEKRIESLGIQLLPEQESDAITSLFEEIFPIVEWGKINWQKMDNAKVVANPKPIIPVLEQLWGSPINKSVYVEWDNGDLPAIKTNLDNVINSYSVLDNMGCAKFIFNPKMGYVIEILFSGDITVGFVDLKKKVDYI